MIRKTSDKHRYMDIAHILTDVMGEINDIRDIIEGKKAEIRQLEIKLKQRAKEVDDRAKADAK